MTYPQPPYPSPPVNYGYPGAGTDPLAPARRASVMMAVVGGLVMAFGLCQIVASMLVPADEVLKSQQSLLSKSGGQAVPMPTLKRIQTIALVAQGLLALCGVALLALCFPARRGSRPATIAAIIFSGVLGAFALLAVLGSLFASIVAPALLVMSCAAVALATMLVIQLIWLFQSLGATSRMQEARAQYLAYYSQYRHVQEPPPMNEWSYGYPTRSPPPPEPRTGDSQEPR
jgi:hypothetical protein